MKQHNKDFNQYLKASSYWLRKASACKNPRLAKIYGGRAKFYSQLLRETPIWHEV